MIKTLKRFIILGLIGFAVYFLLSHHIVFFGKTPKALKKMTGLTFENTFIDGNIDAFRGAEDLLRIEQLRQDGIGQLLVDMGKITQDDLDKIEQRLDTGAAPIKSDLFGK